MGRTLAFATLVAVGACSSPFPPVEDPLVAGAPIRVVAMSGMNADAAEGGIDLSHPFHVRGGEDHLWVVDGGNDRIVRFDSALRSATSIGRGGQGPGELEFPTALQLVGGELLVSEVGNARYSRFDATTGEFKNALKVDGASMSFAVTPAGEILAPPRRSAGHYLVVIDSAGAARPAFPVPERLAAMAAADPERYPEARARVAVDRAGRVHVLDDRVGALARYSGNGVLERWVLLPTDVREQILTKRAAMLESFGPGRRAIIEAPLTKDLSLSDDGNLLILVSDKDGLTGIVVDPEYREGRRIVREGSFAGSDHLYSASGGTLWRGRLLITDEDRIFVFRLEEHP